MYEKAIYFELQKFELKIRAQQPIKVFYEEEEVGVYYADLVVNDCVIVELKAAESLALEHEAQLINYLKATDVEVGLLLNFGKKPEVSKKVFSNIYKK